MKVVKGKYNEAIIFTDVVEETAIDQIQILCNQAFVAGSKIRIMPDVHTGAGATIGTTMTIKDKIVPNLVGVDIGCGMETLKIKNKHIELQKLDKLIYEKIPAGFNIRENPHPYMEDIDLTDLRCLKNAKINLNRAERSLGTLGGGNHFIEVNKDSHNDLYITIHSGSRHLGLEVAKYYQEMAYRALNQNAPEDIEALIVEYKKTGRTSEIQRAIEDLKAANTSIVPKALAYVEGQWMVDYLHDMKIVQEYAALNRKAMMCELVKGMKLKEIESFTTIHNYLDTDHMILRKGAVSAQINEQLLIPINMRDGSLICRGKGNPDWNYSAPHGAGRLMSRNTAKNTFTLSDYKKEMAQVYTTSVNQETLDECPMAYKTMDDIVKNIGDTVEIVEIIKPIYNFKAGDEKE